MNILSYNEVVKQVIKDLQEHRPKDVGFLSSVHNYGTKNGFITAPQARVVGGMYKTTFQGGKYIEHNWWK